MIYLPVILLLISSAATQNDDACETCIKFEGICYNVSHIFDLSAPFRNHVIVRKMDILHKENTIYYSFEPPIEDPEYYKVAYVNLDNPINYGLVNDTHIPVLNFGTFDIDQDNSIVYLGGSDGIFSYGSNKSLTPYSSRGDTISTLFYRDRVFFVKANEKQIVVKKGDEFETILEADHPVKNFLLNKYDVIVYLSTSGLFLNKKNDTVLLSRNPFIRGLTMNLEGGIYAWWIDGIYRVVLENNLSKSYMIKVADMPLSGAMTFDNSNNIVFNMDRGLYKMTKTDTTAC